MDSKYTKGRWKLNKNDIKVRGRLVACAYGFMVNGKYKHTKKTLANALLISKSPEMLQMLEKVLIHVDWSYENWTSNHGLIIEQEIKDLIKEATEL